MVTITGGVPLLDRIPNQLVTSYPGSDCVSVAGLAGNHATHTTARVGHVALVSRYHVNMRVPYRLPGGFAAVCPHVESIRRVSGKKQIPERENESEAIGIFHFGHIEYGHHVALRHNQRVATRDRERVEKREPICVLRKNFPVGCTEDAVRLIHPEIRSYTSRIADRFSSTASATGKREGISYSCGPATCAPCASCARSCG